MYTGHDAWLSDMHVPAYLVDSETRLAHQAQLERGWTAPSKPAKRPGSARDCESAKSRSRGRALLLHCGLIGRAGSGAGAGTGTQSPASRGDGNGGGGGRARWLACRALLVAEEHAHQQMAAAYLQAHLRRTRLYVLTPITLSNPRQAPPPPPPVARLANTHSHVLLAALTGHRIRRTCGDGLSFAARPCFAQAVWRGRLWRRTGPATR